MPATPSTATLEGSRDSPEQCPESKDRRVQVSRVDFEDSPQAERQRSRLYRRSSAIWLRLESKMPRVTQQKKSLSKSVFFLRIVGFYLVKYGQGGLFFIVHIHQTGPIYHDSAILHPSETPSAQLRS
jgi:hypothetical protein